MAAELQQQREAQACAPGDVLAGKYRLEHLLGEGGMGLVWAATHLVTRKRVALKTLHAEAAADPETCRRFVREARAASAVQHPNVVAIHDVFDGDDGAPVLVMDLLDGESLAAHLRRQPVLPIAELARIMLPVVSAVGSAHAKGIVHRDLKPDNIFLAREADGSTRVVVVDFGIAKISSVDVSVPVTGTRTATGSMLGTPHYMSPEQAFGEGDIDHRVDVWALGVILYECLSGRRPTDADNVGQIFKLVTTGGIPSLGKTVPTAPRDVIALVDRMLARDRGERVSDLHEVQAVLSRYADVPVRTFGTPVASQPLTRVASGNDDVSTRALVSEGASRRTRNVGVAVAGVVVGLAVFSIVRHREQPPAASQPLAPVVVQSTPTPTPVMSSAAAVVESSAPPSPLAVVPTQTAHPPHPKSVHSTSAVPSTAPPSCDPPYTIDGEGHRIPKPGCY
jgi:serine/threonine protein kinase